MTIKPQIMMKTRKFLFNLCSALIPKSTVLETTTTTKCLSKKRHLLVINISARIAGSPSKNYTKGTTISEKKKKRNNLSKNKTNMC